MPSGTTTLNLTLALSIALPLAAHAHSHTVQATSLDTVVVTATPVASAHAETDSLVPVHVVSADQLRATGASDLNTALRMLLPGFNFPQPSQLGATDATMPAQLRGLSPDETLVLVNGKRMHTTSIINLTGPMIGRGTSPTDLDGIPIDAIARIEVLRDGAAARYGSDAIAGVINIILKRGAKGGSLHVSHGRHDGGQGDTTHLGGSAGLALGQRGWVRLSADLTHQLPTNHIGPDIRFPADPRYDTRAAHYGLPWKRAQQVAVNAQLDVGDAATLYGFSVINKRDVVAGGAFHSLSEYASISPAAAARYPTGFLPMEHSAIRDTTTVIGLRGWLDAWHYDISVSSGGNHAKMHTSQSINYALGAVSPSAFYDGTLSLHQDIFNADVHRTWSPDWAAALTLASGVAWRHETFGIKAGDTASFAGSGGQGAFGFMPANAGRHGRHNSSVYANLKLGLNDHFSTAAAVRHEHYSDFGNTWSGKLSARYAFTPAVAVRASASNGFRAPSLQQQFFSNTTVEYLNNQQGFPVRYLIGTYPVNDPVAKALGSQPLKPEKSRSLGLGIVIKPKRGPSMTLDVYRVDIRDRIILSGDLVGPAVQTYLTGIGLPGVNGGRFFNNAVDTRTQGADFTLRWALPTQFALWQLQAGANVSHTHIRHIKPNPPQLGLAGLTLPIIDRTEQSLVTVASPDNKVFVGVDGRHARWRWNLRATRYGTWTIYGTQPVADQTYAARVLVDASIGYVLKHWRFTLGANNLTNAYPQRNNAYNSFMGIIPYPFSSPYGFNGRYVYARVGYRW